MKDNFRKSKVKEYFVNYVYGPIPEKPIFVEGKVKSENTRFCASKAVLQVIDLKIKTKKGIVKFPIKFCYQKGKKNQKTVIVLNFRPDVPDMYIPAEEIIDRGYNFVSVYYEDVVPDSKEINKNEEVLRKLSKDSGKIAYWAWGAMRVMDYLLTREEVNAKKTGVAGHSRLGKTALYTAVMDERFKFSHSNDSGACGAGLFSMENKDSEHISDLLFRFSYWFTEKFALLKGKERELEYDQDSLMRMISPRLLSVASAKEDLWANPNAEKKALFNCKAVWKNPEDAVYNIRKGTHYFSRTDWNNLLDFLDERL